MESLDNSENIVPDLWQRFRSGEYELLGEIFQLHYNELYYYGIKLVFVPELVKDTIQDIFTDIWSRKEKMEGVQNIKAYLFVSVRREILRRIEKLRKNSKLELQPNESFEFSVEDFLVREESKKQASQQVIECMKKLSERQREVILLRFNHELEFQDIATVMEMNVQSVRNLLFRALENIRTKVNSPDIEDISNLEIILLNLFQKKMRNN